MTRYDAIIDAWLASGRPVAELAEALAESRAPAVHEAWMKACPDSSRLSPRTGLEQMVPYNQLHPADQAVDVASARTVLDPQLVAVLLAAGRRQALRRALPALVREERAWAGRAGSALWAQARRAVREAIVGLSPKMAVQPVARDDRRLLADIGDAFEVVDPPPADLADDCLTALAGEGGQQ